MMLDYESYSEDYAQPNTLTSPTTKTRALDRKIRNMKARYAQGNSFRLIFLSLMTPSLAVLGYSFLSPLAIALCLFGGVASVLGLSSFAIAEAEELETAPMLGIYGGGQVLSYLNGEERIHATAIKFLNLELVERIEMAGLLDNLLEYFIWLDQQDDLDDREYQEHVNILRSSYKAEVTKLTGWEEVVPKKMVMEPRRKTIAPDTIQTLPPPRIVEPPEPVYSAPAPRVPIETDFFPEEFNESDDLPPIRDLAKEIIALNGSVLLVAKPQSGKTTLLTEVIKEGVRLAQNITVIDGKGNYHLKNSGATSYYLANTPDSALKVLNVVRALLKTLATRHALEMNGHTEFTQINFVIDEINFVRRALKEARYLEEASELDMAIGRLLLQGASVKIYLVVTSHSSRLANFGLDGGEADALSFVALGRARAYESIEDLIKYQMEGRKRQNYLDELDRVSSHEFPETLVLSTIAPLGFFRLPLVEKTAPVVQDSAPKRSVVSTLDKIYYSAPARESEDIARSPSLTPVLDSEPSSPSFLDSLDDAALKALMDKVLEFIKRTGKGKAHEVRSGIRELRNYLGETKQLLAYLEGDGLGKFDSEKNEFTPY